MHRNGIEEKIIFKILGPLIVSIRPAEIHPFSFHPFNQAWWSSSHDERQVEIAQENIDFPIGIQHSIPCNMSHNMGMTMPDKSE
jgi:hypothetical protein